MAISKEHILKNLNTRSFGKIIFSFDIIDSTNTYAKSLPKIEAPHGTIVIADEQTAGRGRLQRSWESTRGDNLLFTIILYPDFGIEKVALLPFVGSLAVADAIDSIANIETICKWPNDVLINNKKISGMLLESLSGSSTLKKIVLGIGVNVNQDSFPDNLLSKATSIKMESGIEVDRVQLLQKILEELENRYDQLTQFPSRHLLDDWKMKTSLFGKPVTILENEFSFSATALDIAENGSLIIQTDDGQKRSVFAGDIRLVYN